MTYDITFIRRAAGESWSDALAAHHRRIGERLAAEDAVMHPRFDHLADVLIALDARYERRDGTGFIEVCDRRARIQVHLFADDVAINVPVPSASELAHELAARLASLAEVIVRETGYSGFDPQLDEPFPTAAGIVERCAAEMMRIRRRIDEGIDRTWHGSERG